MDDLKPYLWVLFEITLLNNQFCRDICAICRLTCSVKTLGQARLSFCPEYSWGRAGQEQSCTVLNSSVLHSTVFFCTAQY